MLLKLKASSLKQTKPYEYVLRFVLGGLTTVFAGVIADKFGPETGGLFLAFPAIFCASATLIEKHERERKSQKGLEGRERGRKATALDAVGAAWGGLALAAFAITVWAAARLGAPEALSLASVVWVVCAAAAWLLRRKLRLREHI